VIFVLVVHKNDTTDIASISAADGSLRILRTLEGRWLSKLSVSPDGRYIVYDLPTAKGSTDRDIFMLSLDNGAEARIVQNPARDTLPVWTPDGNAVVFVSDRAGNDGLWMIRVADGKAREGEAERLKAGMSGLSPIGFAVDGALYYTVGGLTVTGIDTAALNLTTGTLARDTGPLVQRSGGSFYGPAYSPDGMSLAYLDSGDAEPRALERAVRPLSSLLAAGPSAGPISTLNLFGLLNSQMNMPVRSQLNIVIRSLATGQEREIPTELRGDARFNGPVWFPDGQSLILIADGRLHRIDLRTGKDLIDRRIGARQTGTSPSVSPDGKHIYYTRGDDNESLLMVYEIETQREIELFKGGLHPSANIPVSPDGKMIAIRVMGPHALRVLSSSGGEARTLFTPTGEEAFFPISWSPDGKNVLMSRGGDSTSRELWWIPVDGGNAQRIGTGTFPIFNSIHPDGKQIAIARRATSIPSETWVDPAILQPGGQDRRVFEARISSDGSKVTGPDTVTRSIAVLDQQPSWSPDGKSIAFKRGRSTNGIYDLVIRSMTTGEEKTYQSNVGDMGMAGYYWLPDGKSLLVGIAPDRSTYRLDLENGEFKHVPVLDTRPHAVSQDNRTVYSLVREAGTNQINVEAFDIATGQRRLTPIRGFINPPNGLAGILRLSPDGRTLALLTRGADLQWRHLTLVAVDGSSYRDLYTSNLLGMPNGGYTRLLAWTKDGRALLFGQYVEGSRTDVQIMRIPVTGGKPQFTGLTLKGITQEDTIDLSPDRSRLLFSASVDGVSISNR
jgi:Tol biopolymer transport system component